MKYYRVIKGIFVKRNNRFVSEVIIDGKEELVHVKNTGRLKELLRPGVEVFLEDSNNPKRKYKYSIIAAPKLDRIINIDSQAPNAVTEEAIHLGIVKEIGFVDRLKREVSYGDSRFDFYYEQEKEKGFIEVKGVTLEKEGIAMFPDAPTTRGTKHILELTKAVQEGYKATILFVVQMKGARLFKVNEEMDPSFANALRQAYRSGVQILAYDSIITENEFTLASPVPVELS